MYDLYMTVCGICGKGNRIARAAEFAPKIGDMMTNFCWCCMDHTQHRVPPQECLVVWKETPRKVKIL